MNWPLIISELVEAGHRKSSIAAACGANWATIHKLASGTTTTPSYPVGRALVALYEREMHKRVSA